MSAQARNVGYDVTSRALLRRVVGLTALPLIAITAFFPGVCIKLPLIEARLGKKRRVRVVVLERTR